MERIAMSQEERDELHWLKRVEAGSMTQREAAEKMGVTARWVCKLVKRMKKQGDAVGVHGLRGWASSRKLSAAMQRQALTILKKPNWHDFGPTFAAEPNSWQMASDPCWKRDRAWMDDRSWTVEEQAANARGCARLAAAANGLWRTGAMGHFRSRLAPRPRSSALSGADDRRRKRVGVRGGSSRVMPHHRTWACCGSTWRRTARMVDVYTDRDSMFTVPPRTGVHYRHCGTRS
jgi:hypothetical protein